MNDRRQPLCGWGRYPVIESTVSSPRNPDAAQSLLRSDAVTIPRGNGRAYGDAALADTVLRTTQLDCLVDFDTETGVVDVESGITLNQLVRAVLPYGWFLPVTPGTSFASVGGAIAADVHGKNHHVDGSFGRFVEQIDIIDASGDRVTLSRDHEPDWFRATIGGMGLTGLIVSARLRLKSLQSTKIAETTIPCASAHELYDAILNNDARYSVAWVDMASKDIGRGNLSLGEHIEKPGNLSARAMPRARRLPALPFRLGLNDTSIGAFNRLMVARANATTRTLPLGKFFYPLDAVDGWNAWYGDNGFIQYQFVLPLDGSRKGLDEVYRLVGSFRQRPYLAVLKLMGDSNESPLSFPMKGFTLAMDFPRQKNVITDLGRLDLLIEELGGRVYLAKDAVSSQRLFQAGYPQWESFRELRASKGLDKVFQSSLSRRLEL